MLKISAGNEEFGLCGKWLLHGFKIAKLNLQGNPRLMQRSLDNIQHDLLLEKVQDAIGALSGADPVMRLIEVLLADQASALQTSNCGLVQGSPLSPLLSNLYLDALDEEIEAQGVKLVRFADDFVVLCKSNAKAQKVLGHCTQVLHEHGLQVHEDGTRIVNFDKGFDFIGNLFLRSLSIKTQRPPRDARVPDKI
jgi:CRISPR-associated protein Cas1